MTPGTPTLVDLPTGAVMLPSIQDFNSEQNLLPISAANISPSVVVNNDYKDLQREVAGVANLIKKQTRQQHLDSYLKAYDIFKSNKI